MKITEFITSMFYPDRCIYCGRVVEHGKTVCGHCRLPRVGDAICSKCGRDHDRCVCSSMSYSFISAVAPFYYEGGVKKALLNVKYGSRREIPELADEISMALERSFGRSIITDFDLVAYVPMRTEKQRERGFNQARLLAERVSGNFGVPLGDVLEKIKDGEPQHCLTARQRRLNVKGMFSCKGDLEGKNILLIDDIFTTGATLSECSLQMLKHSALSVSAAVVALAVPNDDMVSAEKKRASDYY